MIVLDMEMTGIDHQKCSIISIGAVEFEHPENKFYGECHIWEGAEIFDEALKINGFTRTQLASQQKSHKQLIEEFLAWVKPIKNKTIAGQSLWMDIAFLKVALARLNIPWEFGHRYVDSHALAYEHFARAGKLILKKEGTSDINLDKILEFLGIKVRRNTHNALEDAQLTAEVLSRFIYGKNLLEKYK
ncbi:MAG: 3'-5' exonuclease [Candidatus Woesearchaeota archaeon]|nr:3'-5' exonuclease [Candidatus Woesearchaeota archaeon]